MRASFTSATTIAVCALCAMAPVAAQTSVPIPIPIPTPAPGGTPVTFGGSAIGTPLKNTTPSPIVTTVPSAAPDGPKAPSIDQKRQIFVAGDYLLAPKVFNNYNPQGVRTGQSSYSLRGNAEFSIGNLPLMIGGDFRSYRSVHEPQFVTVIGRDGQTFVNGTILRDEDYDTHLGIKLLEPRVYLGASYLGKNSDTGYPLVSGLGVGLEKLPDYESPLSVYFSAYYYPNLTGRFTAIGTPTSLGLRYREFRYRAGIALAPQNSPVFVDLGILGDRLTARASSPTNEEHFGPYLGIGFYSHK